MNRYIPQLKAWGKKKGWSAKKFAVEKKKYMARFKTLQARLEKALAKLDKPASKTPAPTVQGRRGGRRTARKPKFNQRKYLTKKIAYNEKHKGRYLAQLKDLAKRRKWSEKQLTTETGKFMAGYKKRQARLQKALAKLDKRGSKAQRGRGRGRTRGRGRVAKRKRGRKGRSYGRRSRGRKAQRKKRGRKKSGRRVKPKYNMKKYFTRQLEIMRFRKGRHIAGLEKLAKRRKWSEEQLAAVKAKYMARFEKRQAALKGKLAKLKGVFTKKMKNIGSRMQKLLG